MNTEGRPVAAPKPIIHERWQVSDEMLNCLSISGSETKCAQSRDLGWTEKVDSNGPAMCRTVQDVLKQLEKLCLVDVSMAAMEVWESRVRDIWQAEFDQLTEAEAFAILAFTVEAQPSLYGCVNGTLEPPTGQASALQHSIRVLGSAINKLETVTLETAYRGLLVTGISGGVLQSVVEGKVWKVGDLIQFNHFSSFTTSDEIASRFSGSDQASGIILKVHGGAFRQICRLSAMPREEELLEVPPTTYKVTSRDNFRSKKIVLITATPYTADLSSASVGGAPEVFKPSNDGRPRDAASVINILKEFYRRNDDLCPPKLELEDDSTIPYSLDMLLHTHRLTHTTHTETNTAGLVQVRSADPVSIPELVKERDGACFAFVEAAAGTGKSMMARHLALTQFGGKCPTVLVQLPHLLANRALPYSSSRDSGWEQHILQHLLRVAFTGAADVYDEVVGFIQRRHSTEEDQTPLIIVLDGYDEVGSADSEAVKDTVKLLSSGDRFSASVLFIVTSRPIRDNGPDMRKAVKFNIQPWRDVDGLEYGNRLLAEAGFPEKREGFCSALDKLDADSRTIPLVVDIVARHVLSMNQEGSIALPTSRFTVIQAFVKRHLEQQLNRTSNPSVARFRQENQQRINNAVAEIEEVLEQCALCVLKGCGFDLRSLADSDDCAEAVRHCGLLRTVRNSPSFLYKMLCEYFVASKWIAEFESGNLPDDALDIRFEGAVALFASGIGTARAKEVIAALFDRLHLPSEADGTPNLPVLRMQLQRVIGVAVHLDELPHLVQLVNQQRCFDRPMWQSLFLPGLAAAKTIASALIEESLKAIVVDEAAIAEQCVRTAIENGNNDFLLAILELYHVRVSPSATVQLGVSVLSSAIEWAKDNMSPDVWKKDLQAAATIAVMRQDKGECLTAIFDAFAAICGENEAFVIEIGTDALFPLSESHQSNSILRAQNQFPIHLELPQGGKLRGDKRLDLSNTGMVSVRHATSHPRGDPTTFDDIEHIILPHDTTGWTWMYSGLVKVNTVDLHREGVTHIEDGFLSGCRALVSVNLSLLQGVTRIGSGFLAGCRSLTSVDLSPLRSVNRIGNSLLRDCPSLTSVTFSDLQDVTHIGDYFLSGCSSLTSVNLSPLRSASQIGDRFLEGCHSLTSVDLSPFECLTWIGNSFLHGCRSLTSIKLSGLQKVTRIGTSFLGGCHSLESIDLSPLQGVTWIEQFFLFECRSLKSVDLSALQDMALVGEGFLHQCSSLTSVNLTPLRGVTHIGYSFLHGCNSLPEVDLSPLHNVKEIGGSFLHGCSSLTSVNLSPLKSVTKIGFSFLRDCSSLTSVDLSPLQDVTAIGDDFLEGVSCEVLERDKLSQIVGDACEHLLPAREEPSRRNEKKKGCLVS